MASFTRFAPRWGSPATTVTSSSYRPAQWAKALVLIALVLTPMALASPEDELPEPTIVADIWLPNLDGGPQTTFAPQQTATPDLDEGLLIDTRIRLWDGGNWTALHPEEHELRKRTATTSATSTLIVSVSTASSSPLPTFFDGSLSNNFTSSTCPTFINDMVAADEFQTCYPISLLLPGSTSFFEAARSLVSISRVLDYACAANVTSCANYFANVASNLTKSENCGDDYSAGNPTVTQAYLSLVAYQVVYSATCLKDDSTQSYCYGDAITNTTNTNESYFYFLPLNSSLPDDTLPICGTCLQDTMSIYHVATANRKQPIANTYSAAAQMVDEKCGADFANVTLADAITTSGGRSIMSPGPSKSLLVATVLVMVASWLL